jgi:hypothetical protein
MAASHSRCIRNRDGIFRVIAEGERPAKASAERLPSTLRAMELLIEFLSGEGYRQYAQGVNKLSAPDGVAEAQLGDLSLRGRRLGF